MANGIDRVGGSTPQPQSVGDTHQAQQVTGEYRGQKVQAQADLQSLIQDSLEELPANLSETKSKSLAERTARNKGVLGSDRMASKPKRPQYTAGYRATP